MHEHKSCIVYVVDDEPIISNTLAAILSRAGFHALGFDSPRAAIDEARAAPPDLLISDVVMPGMTGIELAISFRDHYPQCKILLFSGQACTADLLLQAKENGYNFEVLAKPIHPKDLLEKIRTL